MKMKGIPKSLIYLTITRPHMSYGVVSQFMHNLCINHWNVITHIPRYLKKAPRKVYIMKMKGIPKSLDIVMLIEQVLLWANAPL